MQYKDDLYGKKFAVIGIVEEHLKLNNNEWVVLRLPDDRKIEINIRHCRLIDDTSNNKSSK